MTKTNSFGVQVSIKAHRSSWTGQHDGMFIVYCKAANGTSSKPFNNVSDARRYANEVAAYDGSDEIDF